jgi:hypothetical protein
MKAKVGNAHVYYQSISEDRIAVVQILCNALMAFPALRLGQLIDNAVTTYEHTRGQDIFYVSDQDLREAIEWFLKAFIAEPFEEIAKAMKAPTAYEENRKGYEERLKNLELNAMDWQLYSGFEGREEVAKALNAAVKDVCGRCATWQEAQEEIRQEFEKYLEFGAGDTEPDTVLCEVLAHFYACETSRW